MSSWCNFTASKSERAQQCPASFALPEKPRKPGYPALRGTFGHSFLEAGLRGSQEDADMFLFAKEGLVPHWWISDMRKISVEDVRDKLHALTQGGEVTQFLIEAAYSYTDGDVDYLGQSIGRNYPKDTDFNGSIDVNISHVSHDDVVVDFKFGSKEIDAECLQLRNLAVISSEYSGSTGAFVAIAQFDKANDMALPEKLPSKKYTANELALAKSDLDATIRSVKEARHLITLGDTPKVNPGDWCKWCDCTGCENYQGK